MKILIISQYFYPESFRINSIVKSLQSSHDITILTGKPNYPSGVIFDGFNNYLVEYRYFGTSKVIHSPIIPRGSASSIRLILNYFSFIITASIVGIYLFKFKKIDKFDIIFCYAPSPILQALPAILLSRILKIPLILNVQDLWPDSIKSTSHISNNFVIVIIGIIVKYIYINCDLILTQSKSFVQNIVKFGISEKKIKYWPNSTDDIFIKSNKNSTTKTSTKFSVLFAGNLGKAQSVETIIDAATILNGNNSIFFNVAGAGSMLDWMVNESKVRGLKNIAFLGHLPVSAMPNLMMQSSALLISLKDSEILNSTIPNKLQSYLAIGMPIIASINGEAAKIIEESGAGVVVKAEDPILLADAIEALNGLSNNELIKMGAMGRDYYLKHFDNSILISKLEKYFVKMIDRGL